MYSYKAFDYSTQCKSRNEQDYTAISLKKARSDLESINDDFQKANHYDRDSISDELTSNPECLSHSRLDL
jgi:hypothetical protein